MGTRKRIVRVVFPTHWDIRQLEACRARWGRTYEVIFDEPSDDDCSDQFPVIEYIEEVAGGGRGPQDGVFSSSDYPGATVAGAIATRAGLPGPHPQKVIGCSHKYYSRLTQRQAAPAATPWFDLVDPHRPGTGLPFPIFLKPVKGAFSQLARRVNSDEELREFLARPATRDFFGFYMGIFDRLVAELTDFEHNGQFFIAEGLLAGNQTTVEGFACDGEVVIVGIVDSILHPATRSFVRFDYPSRLSTEVQDRMAVIARRVIEASGLDRSFFNIEMIHDPSAGSIHILEVNPRICGQFADLYEKVDGRNSYEMALDLVTGRIPEVPRGQGRFVCAASVPLRTFQPVRVVSTPTSERIRAVEAAHAELQVWMECEPGQALADFERVEDGQSFRYAVVNLGAESPADLLPKIGRIESELGIVLMPMPEAETDALADPHPGCPGS